MYEPPIQIFTERMVKDLAKQQDDFVFQEILKTGVIVDKEELLRALRYDRDQYEKGYADALADLVRCKDCKRGYQKPDSKLKLVHCDRLGNIMRMDDFCSYGERKEDVNA